MFRSIDEQLGRAMAAWVALVLRRPRLLVIGVLLATLGTAPFLAGSLAINSDEEALFAGDAAYAQARRDFQRAFPALHNAIIVVVDGSSASRIEAVAIALTRRMAREPDLFRTIMRPDGGSFFDHEGLLYLEPPELGEVLDRLVEAQPYLGTLTADPSLRGLFGLLADAASDAARGSDQRIGLETVFEAVRTSIEAQARGERRFLDWRELLAGSTLLEDSARRLLLVQPRVDYEALEPAGATLSRLRTLIAELQQGGYADVRVRLTGVYALSQEEAQLVSTQAGAAGLAAFFLVMLVLFGGLRSPRMVVVLLLTLVVGLFWTAALAAFAVGHLNLISVAFAVLFIGLSVDFGIHVSVRVGELVAELPLEQAVVGAARDVGGSLVVCAVTTAIGFYAFLGTDFLGVAELGEIAGSGMLIGLVANLTLLPALLVLWPPRFRLPAAGVPAADREVGSVGRLARLPLTHPGAVLAVTGLATVGAALLVPRAHFDWNPLRVRDPNAPSVQAFEDLLAAGRAYPWNLSVFAADRGEARRWARQLAALPSVKETLTLEDFVPTDQEEKLAWIEDVAFLLLPSFEVPQKKPRPTPEEQLQAIDSLRRATQALARAPVAERLGLEAGDLFETLLALEDRLARDPAQAQTLALLEAELVGSLPFELRRVRELLEPEPVSFESLPEDIRRQWIAIDGRIRVELFPRHDLGDIAALEAYVNEIRALHPDAYGEGLVIYEVGRTVVQAFRQALSLAAVLIFALIALLWRNLRDTMLALLPILLAALFTVAGTVLLGMPFNFANVIVLPLLMGMGVDSGIHMIHRLRRGALPGGDLLHTGTSRAVLLSALTTVASFGALGFSTHRGMGSLGRLLTLGIGLILVCNLAVLTSAVRLLERRRERAEAGAPRA